LLLPMPAAVAPHSLATVPFAIDASLSLRANVERLLGRRVHHRALDAAESHSVGDALNESLSILQTGDAAARASLLDAPMLDALLNPGAAQAWASAVEVATEEGDAAQSVAALAAALVSACSTVAAGLFVSAIGL
jgi:hypothetical protein